MFRANRSKIMFVVLVAMLLVMLGSGSLWAQGYASFKAGSSPKSDTPVLVTVLSDDFLVAGTMDPANWFIPTWAGNGDGTWLQRTQFICTPTSTPTVFNGKALITVQTYNPNGTSFYGYDVITKNVYTQGCVVTFTARLNPGTPGGTVSGLFLYRLRPGSLTLRDEIDIEFLSNNTSVFNTNPFSNEPANTVGHPVYCTYPNGGVSTDWHTYKIEWYADRIIWSVDGVVARTETDTALIPAGPMNLHMNMWVPDSSWPEAYNANLNYTTDITQNQVFTTEVDYVSVEQTQTPVLTTISVTPQTANLGTGGTTTLAAAPLDQAGNAYTATVAWSSDNTSVATVDSSTGLVTGVGAGTANITASSGGITSNASVVTVVSGVISGLKITNVSKQGVNGYVYGLVTSMDASDYPNYGIATYIKVSGLWWIKPIASGTPSSIRTDGHWTINIATGGYDAEASDVVVYLVPITFDIPQLFGSSTIPSSLDSFPSTAVSRITPALTLIDVSPTGLDLVSGQSANLAAGPVDQFGDVFSASVNWSSDNPGVATVDSNGLVNAISVGTANITAKNGGIVSNSVVVNVSAYVPVLTTINVLPLSLSLNAGGNQYLTATTLDQGGNPFATNLYWSSDNASVATVNSSSGLVTAVGSGIAHITASSGGVVSNSVPITVSSASSVLTAIYVIPQAVSMDIGDGQNLTASPVDQYGNYYPAVISWFSDNVGVATVDSTGLVTAISAGTANITASSGGVVSNSVPFTISSTPPVPVLTTINVLPLSASIVVGGNQYLSATTMDQFGNDYVANVTWSSDNPTVATVNASTGLVTAISDGTANITASSGSVVSNSSKITAFSVYTPVLTNIDISPLAVFLAIGGTQALTATTLDQYRNPIIATLYWSSDNPSIATVDAVTGVVTAVAPGTANVTAASGSLVSGASIVTVDIGTNDNGFGIEITRVPVYGAEGNAYGIVTGMKPSDYPNYGVAVIHKINNWWTKPYVTSPMTLINSDGTWSADITTGGVDEIGTQVNAYLVPIGFSIPILSNSDIPDSLKVFPCSSVSRETSAFTTINVTPKIVDLELSLLKRSTSLNAETLDQFGNSWLTTAAIIWTSDNPSVATVDSVTGVVSGVNPGIARITASIGKLISNNSVVTVEYPPSPENWITSSPRYGKKGSLQGVVTGANDFTLTNFQVLTFDFVNGHWWEKPYFNKPAVKVSRSGNWTAKITTGGDDVQATEIRAYVVPVGFSVMCDGATTLPLSLLPYHFADIIRLPAPFGLKKIVITPKPVVLSVGGWSQAMVATGLDKYKQTMSMTVYWTSSNPRVATVDQNGKVTPVSRGSVTIRAICGSVVGAAVVKVKAY